VSDFRGIATAIDREDALATATLDVKMDGNWDSSVQVWSIADQAPRAEFDTILDFGGQRLAPCDSAERMVIVAGAWERHGICAYDAMTGKPLWRRMDLKRVQALSPAAGDTVAACFDTRPMHILDLTSGAPSRRCEASGASGGAHAIRSGQPRCSDMSRSSAATTGGFAGGSK
jgi:hypothetical protein